MLHFTGRVFTLAPRNGNTHSHETALKLIFNHPCSALEVFRLITPNWRARNTTAQLQHFWGHSLFSLSLRAHTFFTFHTWFGLGGWRGVQQPVALAAGAFLVPRDLHTGDVVTESLHEGDSVLRRNRGRSLGSLRHLRQFNREKVSRVSLNLPVRQISLATFRLIRTGHLSRLSPEPAPQLPLSSILSCSPFLLCVTSVRPLSERLPRRRSETRFHTHTHTTMQLDFDDSTQFLPFLERFFCCSLFRTTFSTFSCGRGNNSSSLRHGLLTDRTG